MSSGQSLPFDIRFSEVQSAYNMSRPCVVPCGNSGAPSPCLSMAEPAEMLGPSPPHGGYGRSQAGVRATFQASSAHRLVRRAKSGQSSVAPSHQRPITLVTWKVLMPFHSVAGIPEVHDMDATIVNRSTRSLLAKSGGAPQWLVGMKSGPRYVSHLQEFLMVTAVRLDASSYYLHTTSRWGLLHCK